MREITCSVCGTKALKATGAVNRAVRTGAGIYCSRECSYAARRTGRKALGWYERRFEQRESAGIVKTSCAECGRQMWLPKSKAAVHRRCGPVCSTASRAREWTALERPCETCGKVFRPRTTQIAVGYGVFCSQRCNTKSRAALQSPETMALAAARMRGLREAGLVNYRHGEDSPCWKGGHEAARARRRDSGKQAEGLRRYRAKNPHKVREWSQVRKGRKLGRLAYGSIPRIGKMQGWKCAICRATISKSYHVDHIAPLAKGGKHVAGNIQLLCGPCNLRKSDRDPIIHMQSLGRLL